MNLIVLGLSHKSAPVELRERFSVAPEVVEAEAAAISHLPGVSGAVLLSTCNRTEIYAEASDLTVLGEWFARQAARSGVAVEGHLYSHAATLGVGHAFRVAAGLDSMVLGEPQILGQMKQAVRTARDAGALSPFLDRLFQQTFSVAKEVRTSTPIGMHSVSMSAAAVRLAGRIFGPVAELSVLLIGVGEMVELAATHFAKEQPRALAVANRTLSRGEELARRFGAEALPLAAVSDRLADFDIVVSGTASRLPIIGKGMVERALKARRRRPMLLLDLAVPRDIEPECAEFEDAYLYGVDDLGKLADQARSERQAAVGDAEAIIEREVGAFAGWLQQRKSAPTIVALRERAEEYRQIELEKARQMLRAGKGAEHVIDLMSRSLTNKLLHHPTRALAKADDREREALAGILERLFPTGEAGNEAE